MQKENVHAQLTTFRISYEGLSNLSKSLQSQLLAEKDQKNNISTELELIKVGKTDLKNRLAATEESIFEAETKMIEASSYHENTFTSLKNKFDNEISLCKLFWK